MTIGFGDVAAGLVLATICTLGWLRRRNVGARTWAFRIVPIGAWLLLVFCNSFAMFSVGVLLVLLAYVVIAYLGGVRLEGSDNLSLEILWWLIRIFGSFLLVYIVCVPAASIARMLVWLSPFAAKVDCPWTRSATTDELPFAVEYQRQKTLCAEYDKRIRFKSGRTIGIWPDTGGAGPFAVYILANGDYYLVDGLVAEFIRNEYRVNAVDETVEVKGKYSWILVPDGSLSITGKSDSGVIVETAEGEVATTKTAPIGNSLEGRRFIGMIRTNGKFVAGGHDPLLGKTDARGEKEWNRIALPESVGFALESRRESGGFRNEYRVVFKSGKTFGLCGWLHHPLTVSEFSPGVYQLATNHQFDWKIRLDVNRETVDVKWANAWIHVPEGALEILGMGCSGGENGDSEIYSVTVQTASGEVKGTDFEPVAQEPEPLKSIGAIDGNGRFMPTSPDTFQMRPVMGMNGISNGESK